MNIELSLIEIRTLNENLIDVRNRLKSDPGNILLLDRQDKLEFLLDIE